MNESAQHKTYWQINRNQNVTFTIRDVSPPDTDSDTSDTTKKKVQPQYFLIKKAFK